MPCLSNAKFMSHTANTAANVKQMRWRGISRAKLNCRQEKLSMAANNSVKIRRRRCYGVLGLCVDGRQKRTMTLLRSK